MTATLPPPAVNRVAGYLTPPPAPPLPATPAEKCEAWGDALFAAAQFYQRMLAHTDLAVAERAARAIFDLEKTRLRHGRELAGTANAKPAPAEPPADQPRRKDMPTAADVRRLKEIAMLARDDVQSDAEDDFDAGDDDLLAFAVQPPPATVEEAVEAFARTPMFGPIVEAARADLRRAGRPADDPSAIRHAKELLRERMKPIPGAGMPVRSGDFVANGLI